MNLTTLALYCSAKEQPCTNNDSKCLWVVYGIRSVLLTASALLVNLVFNSQFWQPYQELQYVCNSLPFTLLDTNENLLFSLFSCDIKIPVFILMSSQSLRLLLTKLPKYLALLVHLKGDPFRVTWRLGGWTRPLIHIHMVFLALNMTLNSSAYFSQICSSSWRASIEGDRIPTSSA